MEEEIDPETFGVTPALFKEWRSPRFGYQNPQKVKSRVWEWLVRSKLSGYASTQKMSGPSPFDEGATWCFDRFGQSKTTLPDGRIIYIGGEHEDYYDPDFYIYNDVIVENQQGDIEFYCYKKSDFPPTDFHSATLVGDQIVIIGSLGYVDERNFAETQLYLLDVNTFKMTKVNATGNFPGWIHEHDAFLSSDEKTIIIKKGQIDRGNNSFLRENIDEWKLDLEKWTWNQLTKRKWPRWELVREDKKHNNLYDIRSVLWSHEVNWQEHHDEQMHRLETSMGFKVNFQLIKDIYQFDLEHEPVQEDEDEHNVYWIYVEGVKVRFIEERDCLKVIIEGVISDNNLNTIKQQLTAKLVELEKTSWVLEEY